MSMGWGRKSDRSRVDVTTSAHAELESAVSVPDEKIQTQLHTQLHTQLKATEPEKLTRRPVNISETGLSEHLLLQLLLKHLRNEHVVTIRHLVVRMALGSSIIQELVDTAKHLGWLENKQSGTKGQMRYALSGPGSAEAERAYTSSAYTGIAPVPLAQYTAVCLQQTTRNILITKDLIQQSLGQHMFSDDLISAIGPALNSSKPVLVYGVPGVGKSYLCRHLNLVFGDNVLIPGAIEIEGQIIQVYDPQVHHQAQLETVTQTVTRSGVPDNTSSILSIEQGHDPRWISCERPLLVTGGELTEEMLEISFDPVSRTYTAPLQMKANNGILLLDDLGRQKITPVQLFNRWMIPLEERRDFLSLSNGVHFEIPFELILLFSTNLEPKELVDDAFLRRLGYKIEFGPLSADNYKKLWYRNCEQFQLKCADPVYNYLTEQLHNKANMPFLACYPRDLLSIVSDQIKFNQMESHVNQALLDDAWKLYFVNKQVGE